MRVTCRYIDHHAFGCEQVHPTSPCIQLGKLAYEHVPLSLSLSAATRAPPGRDDTRGLTHQPPTSRRVAGMLGRGGQTSSHRAPGGVAARPAPLRANLSMFGRIVCHPSIRLASLGSCLAPPHPERTSFRPLPSPRGGTASLAASSERPRSWPAGRSSGPLRSVARPRIGIARGMAWRCVPTSRDRWLSAVWSDLDAVFGTIAASTPLVGSVPASVGPTPAVPVLYVLPACRPPRHGASVQATKRRQLERLRVVPGSSDGAGWLAGLLARPVRSTRRPEDPCVRV